MNNYDDAFKKPKPQSWLGRMWDKFTAHKPAPSVLDNQVISEVKRDASGRRIPDPPQ